MKKYSLFLFLLTLSGCCSLTNKCFVDKRFYQELRAYSTPVGDTYLTPTEVVFSHGPHHKHYYDGCKIVENRKKYISFVCTGMKIEDEEYESYNSETMISYEITDRTTVTDKYPLVKETTYSWNSLKKEWHADGGGYLYLEEK